jgi:hypothetical protein
MFSPPSLVLSDTLIGLRQLNFSIIEIFFDSRSNHFNRLASSERTNFCRLARTCYDILSWGLECIPIRVVE